MTYKQLQQLQQLSPERLEDMLISNEMVEVEEVTE